MVILFLKKGFKIVLL